MPLPLLIGVTLALAAGVFARLVGLDRDRAFYSTVTIVVASYYGLFAVMGDSPYAIIAECVGAIGFVVAAVLGFKLDRRWVIAALIAHGVFDFFHHYLITNPGLPVWWPQFCGAYDVTAGGFLVWILRSTRADAKRLPIA
jgi:hypothetical protein